ncbi:hypothetical protein EJ05DRAFT_478359 [Pseudovirgaria hyperparasitica]|uniref:ML-like domain-containing protein n=1 Tax=Pseudovirgaria hyperparasitica TaxID=470096 RepID=A0A6A6W085_9PEZI|nr:uncharacterized protein EJ05DRAFT_478359 [Pseudovirgaria hyperparasitica]KAF2755340.1 hypothetical protein EJ05DRAFT_478359 [Pseudovirgaria hyperparasitica]
METTETNFEHSFQSVTTPRRLRFKRRAYHSGSLQWAFCLTFLATCSSILSTVSAAFINFENCLSRGVTQSHPLLLQFIPTNVSVHLNTTATTPSLNFTIYGNVSGQTTDEPYRGASDPRWLDANDTFGKIIDSSGGKRATLFSRFNVLSYRAYNAPPSAFCENVLNEPCPLRPAFNVSGSDLSAVPGFTVSLPLYSTYAFATLAGTISIQAAGSGDTVACVSANVTPDLGNTIASVLTYLPAAILILVAIATVSAAIFSPWGTSNIFRWTSNYGRDEDLLRLVTPGFGDCLQYIQFIVLSGSLSLNYPGFYQPVVSQAAWSMLAFNNSFVSHGDGYQSLEDGMYNVNGTHGLTRLRQYVGQTRDDDLWAGFAVYLLGISLAVVILSQLGFLLRWGARAVSRVQDGDLRSMNVPFTFGNLIRISFNYFLLPIVALSLYQLVIAPDSKAAVVATATIMLIAIFGAAVWIFRLIFTTRPRAHLFDDLPTLLLYGPLYNTYSDDAAPFAFIPVLLTLIRGVTIGAVQPSGIAQLVVLAICEVILMLTLHAFRPFQAPTSMNAYHTFFAVVRLVAVLLSVSFVPSLEVSEAIKGWIGYVVLLLHAIVLIFGFFLNALQTIIEVVARLLGAGGEARGGLATVFGKRQLSKRGRHRRNQRSSMSSQAAMLTAERDIKSPGTDGRTRSLSASSAILLGGRASSGFDQFSQGGDYGTPRRVSPGGTASPLPSAMSGSISARTSRRPTMGSIPGETSDTFYRTPRMRRPTIEMITGGDPDGESWAHGEQHNLSSRDGEEYTGTGDLADAGEGSSTRDGVAPAYLRVQREDSDVNPPEGLRTTDYAVRESDFYYGVSRGPALSSQPTRRLKTGPADPTGPVASATGWIKGFFGTKRRDKGKGFEVVRSTRAPPEMTPLEEVISPGEREPYRDEPEAASRVREGGTDTSYSGDVEQNALPVIRVPASAPALAPIEGIGGLDLPSKWGSQVSSRFPGDRGAFEVGIPKIPRRSSKRNSFADAAMITDTVDLRPTASQATIPIHLPFRSDDLSPSPERGPSNASSYGGVGQEYTGQPVSPIEGDISTTVLPSSDRPVSTGYVQHHVASDNIRPGIYRLSSGTQAELVDYTAGRDLSPDHTRG